MSHELLKIENLQVGVEDKVILKQLDLVIRSGETHVLMGPNGAGKSTLGYAIMGHPQYNVCQGKIFFEGEDITEESTDVRAKKGIFLSFQNPEEVPGIALGNFLRVSREAVTGEPPRILAFQKEMKSTMSALEINPDYAARYLNVGFSGGEKKKSEILQMLMLNPKLAILDETDSGLDVDAVKVVSKGIRQYRSENNALLIITHNAKILEGLPVDYVHVLANGTIAHTGDSSLIQTINEKGFQFLEAGGVRN
ncbi:Fe-S cluster assembly ATPase SufC [Clostridium minihomine]|uniref:Fe-S cluster assembly ATPase SufC n=1 Tax=Clostridium minihomine TaxID=2045012 RepID=UPI000C7805AE|nr:Fe-S cluster assembly ATPase SufC [Clostridium minihomine]